MKGCFAYAGLAGALVLTGCAQLPSFDSPFGQLSTAPSQTGMTTVPEVPTMSDILTEVQCEIWKLPRPQMRAVGGTPTVVKGTAGQFSSLWEHQYVVYAVFYLDVTDDGAVDPSLSFVRPFLYSHSQALGATAQYGDAAHRVIQQSVTFDLFPEENATLPMSADQLCASTPKGHRGIDGDLGIAQIIAQGIHAADPTRYIFALADARDLDKSGEAAISAPAYPTFGTTIDFTLTYGIGANANWSLQRFVGPSGSPALLNYTRTRKESVVLSFAAAGQRILAPHDVPAAVEAASAPLRVFAHKPTPDDALALQKAAGAAQNAATISLLQRLLPGVR